MSQEETNDYGGANYRQHMLLDGTITAQGNTIRIPLRCMNCKKEKLEAMFADRFPEQQFRVESVEHPQSNEGTPSSLRMRRMVIEFEPKNRSTAAITKLFVELRDAGVQDIERGALSRAFQTSGYAPPAKAQLSESPQATRWSAAIVSEDPDGKASSLNHF